MRLIFLMKQKQVAANLFNYIKIILLGIKMRMTSEQMDFHQTFLNRGGLFDCSPLGEFSKLFEYSKMDFEQKIKIMRS